MRLRLAKQCLFQNWEKWITFDPEILVIKIEQELGLVVTDEEMLTLYDKVLLEKFEW
jgi:hypothetical protein